MERRRCEHCEYYANRGYGPNHCLLEPAKPLGDGKIGRAETRSDDLCRHWEPLRSDNPVAQEAWEQYQMVMKLISNEGKV